MSKNNLLNIKKENIINREQVQLLQKKNLILYLIIQVYFYLIVIESLIVFQNFEITRLKIYCFIIIFMNIIIQFICFYAMKHELRLK